MFSKVSSVKSAGGIKIDKAYFSDSMIYYCEKDFDTNHDGYLSQSEISIVKIIYDLMYDIERYVYRNRKLFSIAKNFLWCSDIEGEDTIVPVKEWLVQV